MDFLSRRAPQDQPLFLMVDFHAPHGPSIWEPQYDGMFAEEKVPRVRGFDEKNVSDKPRYIREGKPPLAAQNNPRVDDACDPLPNSIEQNDCQYPRQLRALQTADGFVADLTDYLTS
jgi:hypothetical protein